MREQANIKSKNDEVIEWLEAIACMLLIWLLVTLLTAWDQVFYRKAIIYRKRVAQEIREKAHHSNSLISSANTNYEESNYGGTVVGNRLTRSSKYIDAG